MTNHEIVELDDEALNGVTGGVFALQAGVMHTLSSETKPSETKQHQYMDTLAKVLQADSNTASSIASNLK